MKYIYGMIFAAMISTLFALTKGVSPGVAIDAQLSQARIQSAGNAPDDNEARTIQATHSKRINLSGDTPMPVAPNVVQYNERDLAWTFFAKVVQLKDVSIYGKPGTIARVEYMKEGEPEYAWVVIKIDDFFFSDENKSVAEGQEIMLVISGEYVSSRGVDWDACLPSDQYCEYASFIEGGFPRSEDYNGLTICPSNILIYSGYASDDWINGMLAWKVSLRNH